MSNKAVDQKSNEKVIKFTKKQIVSSKKYINSTDLLNGILKNDKLYSLNEVDDLIKKFMEKKGRGK